METTSKVSFGEFVRFKRQCLARQVLRRDEELGARCSFTILSGVQCSASGYASVPDSLDNSSATIAGTNVITRLSSQETTDNREKMCSVSARTHQVGQLQTSSTGVQQLCHNSNMFATPSSASHPRMRESGFLRYWICLAQLCME